MNIQDLQQDWNNQGNNNNLVLKLYQESRQGKIDYQLKKVKMNTVLFMILNIFINIYTWLVLVSNFSDLSIRISGILMLIITYIVIYKNIMQLISIQNINNSKPIVELQKLIEKLKIQRIKHNRFIFIFGNLFSWSLVTLIFMWNWEILIPTIWENAAILVIIHISFAVVWFPLSFWILRKYDTIDASKFWKKLNKESFLTDESVNSSLNNALLYVKEIESFENED